MLSPEETTEIEHELAIVPYPSGACIEALKAVQKHRGWVSDEAVRDVANLLGMSPEEVDSVATFYNLVFRHPVGRHVIFLCDSVSCWITGLLSGGDSWWPGRSEARLRVSDDRLSQGGRVPGRRRAGSTADNRSYRCRRLRGAAGGRRLRRKSGCRGRSSSLELYV